MNNEMEQLDEVLLDRESNNNERIGFGRRFGAYMLDFLAIMVFGSIVGMLIGADLVPIFFSDQVDEFERLTEQFGDQYSGLLETMLEIIAGTSITGLGLFIMEGAIGQSVGKMILKIKNTNVDGSAASPTKLWLRSLLKYGSSILSLIGGAAAIPILGTLASLIGFIIFIGFFFVFGDNKQTLHDMIAKTVVSRK